MMADAIVSHRIVPRRGSFRLEAVTATGAIEVLAIYPGLSHQPLLQRFWEILCQLNLRYRP